MKKTSRLLDSTCAAAFEAIKPGMARTVEDLAKMASEAGAWEGSTKLGFLKDDQESDGAYLAELIIRVQKV